MRWRIHPVGNFLPHGSVWDALNSSAGDLPFLRADFLLPALAQFGTGQEYLAVADESGTPVAMGIFRRARQGFWETFQPSQLPLGAFVSARGLQLDAALDALGRALPGVVLGV